MKKGRRYGLIALIVGIVLIVAVVVALYFTFNVVNVCGDVECYKTAMNECKKVTYTNDAAEATWKYTISGKSGVNCVVDVELLQAKEGQLGLNKLNGLSMECIVRKDSIYPEKDINRCNGRLKEELQEIIISKLHQYIIDNIGDLNNTVNSL